MHLLNCYCIANKDVVGVKDVLGRTASLVADGQARSSDSAKIPKVRFHVRLAGLLLRVLDALKYPRSQPAGSAQEIGRIEDGRRLLGYH
jgi:hypothetical protein